MSADPFTAVCPTHQRAKTLGTRPLPIGAGEVLELPRRRSVLQLLGGILFFAAGVVVLAAIWKATGRL
jgi:hypothetical protein